MANKLPILQSFADENDRQHDWSRHGYWRHTETCWCCLHAHDQAKL